MASDPYSRIKHIESNVGDRKYPNPFFDLANNHIPSNIKSLFKYCHSFFHTDPFLSNVVRKVTEYPLTEILYDTEVDLATRKKYDKILHEKLNINTFLLEIGLDYHTYGNCFISMFAKKKRFLKIKGQDAKPIDKVNYKFRNFEFYIKDPVTGDEVKAEVMDEAINSMEAIRMLRWNPENIDIDYNPITGESTYYYNIPNDVRKKITRGEKSMIEDTPMIFMDAIKNKKRIELDKKSFYHFKRPGLSESDMGWGKPMILAALKKIYYLQILQRGNEAIAHEHIVPKKAISPANTATLDPLTQLNLPKWKGQIEGTVKKWKRDPNHIAVFPIPIGYQELGGNARGLMLTPEMKFLEESIINSLGVPIEFIKGGASWTGSSVSLRIVENMFLTYRNLLLDFLNHFLIPKLVSFLNYPEVKLKFKAFKMSDDAQSKQLMLQLAELGKLSDQQLLDAFGFTYEEVTKEMKATMEESLEQQKRQAKNQAEAQGEATIIQQKMAVRAQIEAQREQIKQRLQKLEEEIMQEQGQTDGNYADLIESLAVQLMYLPPELQVSQAAKLQKEAPVTHGLVMETVQMYQESGVIPRPDGSPGNPAAGAPAATQPAEKSPGQREENKVKTREKEKTKGQTRGTP